MTTNLAEPAKKDAEPEPVLSPKSAHANTSSAQDRPAEAKVKRNQQVTAIPLLELVKSASSSVRKDMASIPVCKPSADEEAHPTTERRTTKKTAITFFAAALAAIGTVKIKGILLTFLATQESNIAGATANSFVMIAAGLLTSWLIQKYT